MVRFRPFLTGQSPLLASCDNFHTSIFVMISRQKDAPIGSSKAVLFQLSTPTRNCSTSFRPKNDTSSCISAIRRFWLYLRVKLLLDSHLRELLWDVCQCIVVRLRRNWLTLPPRNPANLIMIQSPLPNPADPHNQPTRRIRAHHVRVRFHPIGRMAPSLPGRQEGDSSLRPHTNGDYIPVCNRRACPA